MAVTNLSSLTLSADAIVGGTVAVTGASTLSGAVTASTSIAVGSGGTAMTLIKKGTIAIDPGSIADKASAVSTLTITGAATGDIVILNPGTAGFTAGIALVSPYVSAANTVKVTVANLSGGTLDEASLTCAYILLRS